MPRYRVTVERVLMSYQRGYHYVEAIDLLRAQEWADKESEEYPDEMDTYYSDDRHGPTLAEDLPADTDIVGVSFKTI